MPNVEVKTFADEAAARHALEQRSRAYKLALTSPAGQEVMIDLAVFCRGNKTTWSEDARHHARLEGRREVWLRIQEHLGLTPEELFALYSGVHYNTNPGLRDENAV